MSGSQLLLLGGTPQVASDPNFEYTTLLLPGNGTNGAQNNTFLDSSTNNFTITRNGNTTQGTFSPFSQTGWGNYFDGSGDYLTVADNAALQMGSGDFTIEYWWYPNNITSYQNPIDKGYTGAGGLLLQTGNGDGRIIVYASSSAVITSSTSVTVNAWNHMALVRSGTTLTLYQNGVSVGSATNSTNFNNTTQLGIGATGSPVVGSFPVVGYLSNVRFVKGTAVYSGSTYTVPTAPLTAITNTSLLTCQSNRFIDNSTNAFAITRNGDVSVQAFSPFNPTAAWSASTNGGSGYFDGSGDFLQVADAAPMELGSGNWTIEMWVNTLNNTQYSALFTRDDGGTTAGSYVILLNTTSANGIVTFWSADVNSFTGAVLSSGTTSCRDGAWHHIAVVRNSNTLTMYIDGTATSTASFSGSFGNTAQPLKIGSETGYARDYTGYISNVRLVVGSAVYTANFTPPTAPLTAITNTQLLLNYTNAGIYDATSKNDLETVGNAQISTTQSKFGGSSMYFDGTGDRITTLNNGQTLTLGTGDFTIEMWLYANTVATTWQGLIDWRPSDTSTYPGLVLNTNTIKWVKFGGAMITSSTISATTWYHVVVCRSGSSTKMFVNGTQVGSTYTDTNNYISASTVRIGSTFANEDLNGYINDLRITKGVARYTANFTAPTAAFPLL